MDELLAYLESSIADEVFSKNEKKTFKALVREKLLDQNQLNFLRSRIYELANEKVNADNSRFIIDWIKTATSALTAPAPETTDAFFSPGDACRRMRSSVTSVLLLRNCIFVYLP